MGTLMVDFITSLDGYGAAEGWPGWWGMESAEYLGWLGEQPEHTVLMGATTYRLMSGFAASGEEGVDEALTKLSKVVFFLDPDRAAGVGQHATGHRRRGASRASDEGRQPHRVAHAGQCESVPIADRGRTGGSLPGCRLPGRHRCDRQDRIYDGYPDIRLELVESRTFEGGIQLLEYVPTVLDGPPGTTGAAS
jgi:hypothetical protein